MESLPKNADHPVITMRDSSCTIQNEDSKWVFVGFSLDINKNTKLIKEFMSHFEIYNNDTLLSEGKDGVYTWIIYGNNEQNLKFACIQVLSPFEIGTGHRSLLHNSRVKADRIYGAGELMKKDKEITYNLNSGTYTYKIVRFNFSPNKVKSKAIKDAFAQFFPNAVFSDDRESMIHKINVIPNKILEFYSKYGYSVFLFNIKNDCVEFSNKYNGIHWNIDYFTKKLEEAVTLDDKVMFNKILLDSIKSMIELLKTAKTNSSDPLVGGKKTRRRRSARLSRRM